MAENLTLSIIVPVYNSEKSLSRCVDTILAQTFKNFECILVDDGSTDSSLQICEEYAQKDKRVKVIHKINAGVSAARNDGLKTASGDYAAFVDSDDYIHLEMYERMYNAIAEQGADLVCCGYTHKNRDYIFPHRFTYRSIAEAAYYLEQAELFGLIWNKLYPKNDQGKKYPVSFGLLFWRGYVF